MGRRRGLSLRVNGTPRYLRHPEYEFLKELPKEVGWFTVSEYMRLTVRDLLGERVAHLDLGKLHLWQLFDKTPPKTLKCASMRLIRHARGGFFQRKRYGQIFLYRVRNDGWGWVTGRLKYERFMKHNRKLLSLGEFPPKLTRPTLHRDPDLR
jgi:hypothetical protein